MAGAHPLGDMCGGLQLMCSRFDSLNCLTAATHIKIASRICPCHMPMQHIKSYAMRGGKGIPPLSLDARHKYYTLGRVGSPSGRLRGFEANEFDVVRRCDLLVKLKIAFVEVDYFAEGFVYRVFINA